MEGGGGLLDPDHYKGFEPPLEYKFLLDMFRKSTVASISHSLTLLNYLSHTKATPSNQ